MDEKYTLPNNALIFLDDVPGGYLINNLLTKSECEKYIQQSSEIGYKSKHSKRSGPPIRTNSRVLYEATEKEAEILSDRLRTFVSKIDTSSIGRGWKIPSEQKLVNYKWRFNRYRGDEVFHPHFDSGHDFSPSLRTVFSLIIYLNDDFEGGETCFFPGGHSRENMFTKDKDKKEVQIKPSQGSALLFFHYGELNPLHYAKKVIGDGTKYIIRADLTMENEYYSLKEHLFGGKGYSQRSILLLGKPGAGKTSLAKKLSKELKWDKILFGDLIRDKKNRKDELSCKLQEEKQRIDQLRQNDHTGSGWYSNNLTKSLLEENINQSHSLGHIFEGFPRERTQTLFFESSKWNITRVYYLNIDDTTQMKRMNNRPVDENRDPSIDLATRNESWGRDTFPLVDHFKKRGQLCELDGTQNISVLVSKVKKDLAERTFDLAWENTPSHIRELLKGFKTDKDSKSRNALVYEFKKNDKVHYLKINFASNNMRNFKEEYTILKSGVLNDFPLDLPVVTHEFKVGEELDGGLSIKVPGETLKAYLKQGDLKEDKVQEVAKSWNQSLKVMHNYRPDESKHQFPRYDIDFLMGWAKDRIQKDQVNFQSFSAKYRGEHVSDIKKEFEKLEQLKNEFTFNIDSFLHGDPCAPNIIFDPEKKKITGCLDISKMGFGDAYWDLALASWSFQYNCGKNFYNTLGEHYFGDNFNEDKLNFMYSLARFLL